MRLIRGLGALSLRGQAEKAGTVQTGEENFGWRLHSNLPASEGVLQGSWRGTLDHEL